MAKSLSHRGPDNQGILVCDEVAVLGHARLSIIDLTVEANQPMEHESARYVLVYNGEIYNFMTLRAELEALGHRFRTRSDTEVVLAAYAEWGTDAFARFNGMFALPFGIDKKRSWFLRDRFGQKPLYYLDRGQLSVLPPKWALSSKTHGSLTTRKSPLPGSCITLLKAIFSHRLPFMKA